MVLRLTDDSPFAGDLFARGYIFRQDAAPRVPGHWRRDLFAGFHLAHDPRLGATRVAAAGCDLLALGILCDVRRPDEDAWTYLTRLAGDLARGEDALHQTLDHSAGRYVLAYAGPDGRPAIVSDATGMRQVFYYTGAPRIITSHPHLIPENSEAEPRGPIRHKFGYPGLRGPVRDSYMLTPNARLDMGTATPARVWPRAPIARRSLDEAAGIVGANMAGAVRHARRNHDLLVSITGGLDSRVTLSFLKDAPDVPLFTYFRKQGLDHDGGDLDFARSMADDHGRDVSILRTKRHQGSPEEFKALLAANTFMTHQTQLAWIYHERFAGGPPRVHLRSNVSEAGREFWAAYRFPVTGGRDLARIYLRHDETYKANHVFRVIELFEEFDAVTGLTACADMVDVKSLFYWEFRMASWHAQLVAESDTAFDSLSPYNCRATLQAMLSVPPDERRAGTVLRRVIARNWPALTRYPVNGAPFGPEAAPDGAPENTPDGAPASPGGAP